jgi:hypothetical protein
LTAAVHITRTFDVLVAIAATFAGGLTAPQFVVIVFESVMPQPRALVTVIVSVTLDDDGVYVIDELVVALVIEPPLIDHWYVQPEQFGTDAVRPDEQATGCVSAAIVGLGVASSSAVRNRPSSLKLGSPAFPNRKRLCRNPDATMLWQ